MKKTYYFFGFIIIIALSLSGCGTQNAKASISKELGIDFSSGNENIILNNHAGIHGDGITYITIDFLNKDVLNQIASNNLWNCFPLDEVATTLG